MCSKPHSTQAYPVGKFMRDKPFSQKATITNQSMIIFCVLHVPGVWSSGSLSEGPHWFPDESLLAQDSGTMRIEKVKPQKQRWRCQRRSGIGSQMWTRERCLCWGGIGHFRCWDTCNCHHMSFIVIIMVMAVITIVLMMTPWQWRSKDVISDDRESNKLEDVCEHRARGEVA